MPPHQRPFFLFPYLFPFLFCVPFSPLSVINVIFSSFFLSSRASARHNVSSLCIHSSIVDLVSSRALFSDAMSGVRGKSAMLT